MEFELLKILKSKVPYDSNAQPVQNLQERKHNFCQMPNKSIYIRIQTTKGLLWKCHVELVVNPEIVKALSRFCTHKCT